MANVTDSAFRFIIAKYGKPDVMWTEFVSADGLALAPEDPPERPGSSGRAGGRKKLLKDLEYSEAEHPIVAQFFTSNTEHMRSAAELARKLGFNGVDINMGCPDRTIEKQGAGAQLMKDAKRARELIRAAKEGAGDLPVSLKTRTGYNKPELDTWLPEVLKENPAVVTIHARTRKEMSKVPARWEFVKRAVEIRDKAGAGTLIFGNGDVKDLKEAGARVKETGCDGVMLGRAIFGNPWLFKEYEPTKEEKLKVLVEHTKLFEKLLGGVKSFAIMKKHFKAYVNGFEGAVDLRARLMETDSAGEVETIIAKFSAEE